MIGHRTYIPRSLAMAFGALLLSTMSACSILPEAREVRVFDLPTQLPATSPQAPVNWSLRIATPKASRFLSGVRIVIQPQPNEVAVYKDARWSNPIPLLLRDRLMQEFQADGRIAAISSDDLGVTSDLELNGTLRAFQNEYGQPDNQIVIQFDAQLINIAGQRIIASRRFEVRQSTVNAADQDKSFEQVIDAFGLAGDRLAQQVSDWTFRQAATKPFPIVDSN